MLTQHLSEGLSLVVGSFGTAPHVHLEGKNIYVMYNKCNEKQDVCSADKSMYSPVKSGRSE